MQTPWPNPYQSDPDYINLLDANTTFAGSAAYNVQCAGTGVGNSVGAGNSVKQSWFSEVSDNCFDSPEVRVPIADQRELQGYSSPEERADHSTWGVGRLTRGITNAQAENDLNAIGSACTGDTKMMTRWLSSVATTARRVGSLLSSGERTTTYEG